MSGFEDIENDLLQVEEGYPKQDNTVSTQDTIHNFKTTIFQQENYQLTVKPTGKQYKYTLSHDEEIVDEHTINKKPGECNKDTQFIRRFIKQLEGNVKTPGTGLKYTKDQISTILMQQVRELQSQLDNYEENKDEITAQETLKRNRSRIKEVKPTYNELIELLHRNDETIIDYIRVCITYLINGENKNTLVGLLCHLSTYFKRGALWFMAVGKSGEGKSRIEQASIDLLPDSAYMNGRMSEAALYRKSLGEGENFLDGKILRFGDFGGKDDFKKHEDMLNQCKQLSTEGKTELELTSDSIDEDIGERGTTKYLVRGYCSVSLATVHTEDIDEQYRNRGRLVEPESSNEHVKQYNIYNNGLYAQKVEDVIDYYINYLLHDYLECIQLLYKDKQVLNPYLTCLLDWLESDTYFKRSSGQYIKLVETVTILNYPFRDKVKTSDGVEYVVSTREDNELVARLFLPSFGISPVAIRVFNKIIDWNYKYRGFNDKGEVVGVKCKVVSCDDAEYDTMVRKYEESVDADLVDYQDSGNGFNIKDFTSVFTVSQIQHKCNKYPALKGVDVGGIIGNLMQKGYIEATGVKVKKGNKNVYKLSRFEPISNEPIDFDDDEIGRYMSEEVQVTYGDIEYVPPHPSVEMKNILDDDKLRECSIGGLGVAKWF
jgi:hypothetical protein